MIPGNFQLIDESINILISPRIVDELNKKIFPTAILPFHHKTVGNHLHHRLVRFVKIVRRETPEPTDNGLNFRYRNALVLLAITQIGNQIIF